MIYGIVSWTGRVDTKRPNTQGTDVQLITTQGTDVQLITTQGTDGAGHENGAGH